MNEDCKVTFEKWVTQTPADHWVLKTVESKLPHTREFEIIAHDWGGPIQPLIDTICNLAPDINWDEIIFPNNVGETLSDSWFLFISPSATYRLTPLSDLIYHTEFMGKEEVVNG